MARLSRNEGSVQSGTRPVIVIQNNKGNMHSPTVIVATLTSNLKKSNMPTHVLLTGCGLIVDSVVQCEQIHTLDKSQLCRRIGAVPLPKMQQVNDAIMESISLRIA